MCRPRRDASRAPSRATSPSPCSAARPRRRWPGATATTPTSPIWRPELDDIWMRDIGANFLVNGQGGLTAMDFNFNGWGDKQRHASDALLAGRAARRRARATCAASWWAKAAASRWTAAAPAS
ncbi:agmatine deiminase family protein [Achromobacter insuavis]